MVAIVTKFDTFVQDVQQQVEEAAEEEDREVDDDTIEKQAVRRGNGLIWTSTKLAISSNICRGVIWNKFLLRSLR